jgi:hypothetical protein
VAVRGRRTIALCGCLLGVLAAGVLAPGARAQADPLAELKSNCSLRQSADPAPRRGAYRLCSGRVRSFDGTALDATLTLPAGDSGEPRPLIVFLHGFLANKGEYLSQTAEGTGADRGRDAYKTVRWNNVWFASRGYAVLNYTARGHEGSDGSIGLASKEVEVRDTRHLTGLLADDPGSAGPLVRVDPRRLGVLGSSYGGGQAWLLLTTRADPSLQYGSWRSPQGRLVELAAVVPQYTWSDLFNSLVPNGHQLSSGVEPARANTPVGVGKQTLIDGFVATAGTKFTPEIIRWLTRFNAGEPYDLAADPIIPEAKRALSEDRSAFFQRGFFEALRAGRQRRVPVLAGQGWTDPIFPALEAVRMEHELRTASPGYPIQLYLGDFEHLTSLVKIPDLGHLHDLGNRLLDRALRGTGDGVPFDAQSAVTNCDARRFGPVLRARRFSGLGPRPLRWDLEGGRLTSFRTADPRGVGSDPVVVSQTRGRGCITTSEGVAAGVASWTRRVDADVTMAGLPRLRLRFRTPAPDVELNSRLWDVAPDGSETLVTRGAYRAVGPNAAGETAVTELFGNAWRFRAGHRMRLEVTQDDGTYLRPDNVPSAVAIDGGSLELPTTAAAQAGQPGGQAVEEARRRAPAPRGGGAERERSPPAPTAAGAAEGGTGTLPFTGAWPAPLVVAGLALLAAGAALRRRRSRPSG